MSTSPKGPGGSLNRGAGGAQRPSGGSNPKPAQPSKATESETKKKKVDADAAPPSEAVLSSRDFVNEPEPAEGEGRVMLPSAPDEARPTSGRKLLESLPFFQVDPAPYDPKVPPLPAEQPAADIEPATTSGLIDIRGMTAIEEEAQKQNRADEDLLNLSGGLFGSNMAGPIAPPDAKAFGGASSSKRASAPAEVPRPAPSSPGSSPTPSTRAAPAMLAPVISSVAPPSLRTKELMAAKRSARIGWVVAVVAGGAALLLLGLKLGQSFSGGANGAPSASPVTTSTAASESTSKADLFPPVAPKRAEEPSVDDAPAKPKTPGEVATADKPAPVSPSAQAPGNAPSGAGSPTVVKGSGTSSPGGGAPAPTQTAVATAAPAEPSGGVEFNKAAAKTALAMAAAAAAGCKQPDEPGGGAKVSVTFAPSGRVTSAKVVSPPFQGTPTGGCIASSFRGANVPPFDGPPVTTTWDVSIR